MRETTDEGNNMDIIVAKVDQGWIYLVNYDTQRMLPFGGTMSIAMNDPSPILSCQIVDK